MSMDRYEVLNEILSFLCVLLVLALFGALTYYMWRVEGRSAEDTSFLVKEEEQKRAETARAVLPLLDKLEKVRLKLSRAETKGEPVDAGKVAVAISNAVAVIMPELATSKDSQGNAVLMPIESARKYIGQILKESENFRSLTR